MEGCRRTGVWTGAAAEADGAEWVPPVQTCYPWYCSGWQRPGFWWCCMYHVHGQTLEQLECACFGACTPGGRRRDA